MDVREKLEVIAHLGDHITYKEDIGICYDSALAKVIEDAYMTLKNGVTVQEWISVKDRLPPYNHDVLVYRPNMAMKIMVDSYNGYYGEDDNEWYEGWAKYGKDIHNNPIITHWQPMPQPPKGE